MKNRKGLFIGLSWLAFMIVVAISLATMYLIYPRIRSISTLVIVLWALLGLGILIVGGGLLLITFTAFTGFDVLYPHNGKSVTMRVLFPVVLELGGLLGFEKINLMEAFVDANNALLWAQRERLSTERILILLPHCLQFHECQWRITHDIENCKRCGKCVIAEIAELGDKYTSAIRVATGGTLARKVVSDYGPTLIVAVACGRDLSSGIIDSHPIPVFGVPNQRPNGPCFDTTVDVGEIERLLESLTNNVRLSEHTT
ncbi:DUF116 domain-containing protein [bacterium]|nr:DUF116 domain-containing protein [bacterium]